jgi:hypothetical protein
MAKTLVQLCAEAIESLGPFNIPTTIIGNSDPDAAILKWAATQTGRELVRSYSWQVLLSSTTITTVAGTYQYSLPADFRRFSNETFYNITEERALYGPMTPSSWAELTKGITLSTFDYSFRVAGNYLEFSPTPTSVQTLGYDYYSKYYSTDSGGTAQANWAVDTDLPRLDDDLFVLGIRYRFLQRKELPFAEDKADYLDAIQQSLFDDTPKAVSNLSGTPTWRSNVPDINWG